MRGRCMIDQAHDGQPALCVRIMSYKANANAPPPRFQLKTVSRIATGAQLFFPLNLSEKAKAD